MNSNPDPQSVVFGAIMLGALTTLCIYFFVRSAQMLWARIKYKQSYLNGPHLIEYSGLRACEGPHSWEEVTLAVRGIEPGSYRVCNKCGQIQGRDDVMLNEIGVQQMNEAAEIRGQIAQAKKEYTDRVNGMADNFILSYIRREFPEVEQDLELGDRLFDLAKFSFDAQNAAIDKVNAEVEAQKDLDERYKDWADKIKGNA